jgi:putative ABC transport system permease protein
VRGNPGALAARLPVIAAEADERLYTQESRSLEEWIRAGDSFEWLLLQVSAGITALVLFLSALGIFSLMSVTVSRRTREIGLRVALGARPHHVMVGILSKGIVLMGSGIIAGGALVLLVVANGGGPTGQAAEDVPLFAMWVGMTAVVMLTACVLACIGPARRALGINPTEALRDS